MKIKASAPGRCGIAGNPTDMYGGSVLALSTRERASCTLAEAGAMQITVSGQTQMLHTAGDLSLHSGEYLNVARAVLSALEVDPEHAAPFHLSAETDVPMAAGLAGSTAILACLTGAVLAHLGLRLGPYETAELVRTIEYDTLGIVCGFQDAYMTVFGGLSFLDFAGRNSAAEFGPDTPLGAVEPLGAYVKDLPFVLAHTGVRHHSGSVHATPRERWMAGDPAAVTGYAEIASLARTAKRALLSGDCGALASAMTRNHAIVRDLGGSGDANEALIAAALSGGALAAKLAGAGGGGTILALTLDPERTIAALTAAGAEAILVPAPVPGLTVEKEA